MYKRQAVACAENGQSNFGTGYGYQRIDDHIEVLIDNQWIVFEVIEPSGVPQNGSEGRFPVS